MNKLENQIMRSVRQLAQKECANYEKGRCLPEDRSCHVISAAYKTIHDGAVGCDYFLDAVLPLQPALNTAVWHELLREEDQAGEGWKECVRCHRPFIPGTTGSGIVPIAAQQQSRPGTEKSSAAIGNGRKHRRDRYPLERNKSRKINASRTPHRGRTIYGSSCPISRNVKESFLP